MYCKTLYAQHPVSPRIFRHLSPVLRVDLLLLYIGVLLSVCVCVRVSWARTDERAGERIVLHLLGIFIFIFHF